MCYSRSCLNHSETSVYRVPTGGNLVYDHGNVTVLVHSTRGVMMDLGDLCCSCLKLVDLRETEVFDGSKCTSWILQNRTFSQCFGLFIVLTHQTPVWCGWRKQGSKSCVQYVGATGLCSKAGSCRACTEPTVQNSFNYCSYGQQFISDYFWHYRMWTPSFQVYTLCTGERSELPFQRSSLLYGCY